MDMTGEMSAPWLPNLIEQPLAFQQVEQRFLKQRTVVTGKLSRIRLHRPLVIGLAETKEPTAWLGLCFTNQHFVFAAR